jgi:hypothetical protein
VVHDAGELARDRQQLVQINARLIPRRLKHVDGVLAADVAAGTGCVRATAQAAQRAIQTIDALLNRSHHVGQPHATCVVEMQGQLQPRQAFEQRCAQLTHLCRMSHAGGVTDHQPANSETGDAVRPFQHHGRRYYPFHRAAKTGRERHVDGHIAFGHGDHIFQSCKAMLARHAQIGQVVRFRTRHHKVQLVRLALDGPLCPTHIGHQYRVFDARHTFDAAHDGLSIPQHGDGLGRCEGRDLDLGVAAAAQGVDQRNFCIGGHKLRFDLKTVAGHHFVEKNASHVSVPPQSRAR